MISKLPKIIAAHDLSGMGKASLTVAIPILSSMGSYVCPLPTAVLSTITGVFEGFSITDLTTHMKQTIKHWETLNIDFDYIYSGFLGNHKQVDIIIDAANTFGSYLVVDPVFADNGKLYPTMNDDMVKSMKRLVAKSSLITPNATEAQFLLDEKDGTLNKATLKKWLKGLSDMGPQKVVITSCLIDNNMYVGAYDKLCDEYLILKCDMLPVQMHGTGDIFTSVLVGATVRGDSFATAITLASEFVKKAIKITLENKTPPREGARIETILDFLNQKIQNECERF